MSPKGGIRPHKRFSVQSNRSEVLFVDYIAEHLTQDGRAAVIVPEGIIFQSGNAYKQLRKMLVEKYLVGVISLPSGVFNPYSGVKTSILWIDKSLAKKTDKILFVKIENDGFDLGAQRRAIKGNDMPDSFQKISDFKKQIILGNTYDLASEPKNLLVSKSEISINGEYNLSEERYRKSEIGMNTNYPLTKIGDLCSFEYGKPLKKEDRIAGDYPVFGSNGIVDYHSKFLVEAPFIVVGRKGSAGEVHYSDKNGFPIDTTFYIKLTNENKIRLKYLFIILKSIDLKNVNVQAGVPGLNRNDAYEIQFPLPPLPIQEEIIAEIESYQKIIDGARQVVENYKPRIDIDPAWEMVRMGDVCDFVRGPFGGSLKKETFVEKGYCVYEQRHAISDDFVNVRYYISEEKFKEMKRFEIKPGDLIMSCSGTMGKIGIAPPELKSGIINQALLKLSVSDKINNKYLRFVINSDLFQKVLSDNTYGAAIKNVASVKVLQELKIPLPSVHTQLEIVNNLQLEHSMIDSNRQLISHRVKQSI